METLHFRFENGRIPIASAASLIGVVGSGNLEVMIEPVELDGACELEISTAAHGFASIWEAVVADFHRRWPLMNARVAINDLGATPAVVSLRLDQAAQSMTGT